MEQELDCLRSCDDLNRATEKLKMENQINNPAHYNRDGTAIECQDYIASHDFNFFEGSVIKYITRWKFKGAPLADLHKAKRNVERLIEIETKRMADAHNKIGKCFSGQVNK